MKIINIVGARPNFMKMAPIIEAMNRYPEQIKHLLVHTGQHYDEKMSKAFFDDLGMPKPDIDLEVGSGSHAEQTARIMVEFEKVCLREKPDLGIVVGDVNSTMACTITAKKLGIKVAHVEAGLRSRDMGMPEEINRLCTDVLCDYLFTTDYVADRNLKAEGVPEEKIHFVGNVMIDTLRKHERKAESLTLLHDWGLEAGRYATMTLHRPSNVDDPHILAGLLEALADISRDLPIVFPIHPRTRKMAEKFGLEHFLNSGDRIEGIWCTEPLGYLEFLHLNMNAKMVLTDSGGLQEETTVLGVPCITMRHNTERPITCTEGTNRLVGNDPRKVKEAAEAVLRGDWNFGQVPEKWDGKAAERIVQVLLSHPPTAV
ncbi:UDP-N-acetylglucosamine 2-epimerase (non-hydrolysing) [Geothermobacter ehrlichii]|uniref:UDP-N-acetylglucosamine 2-epimerase (Non-hydrolysing) n=1 Tax=Geothermobacter ehrlichii TaxID=213224 RepID=A0A5D3WJI4_9BACT|nr:UDP-N-acetylglucosamine 2-epimerase (non-hydrolyzing) [Geothermobacter ehrlichii]TYO98348.1 UDP-N-acetylglucosamine 2-epimerase (non-hydrolysing) [Geothermobacter ehrlichii]